RPERGAHDAHFPAARGFVAVAVAVFPRRAGFRDQGGGPVGQPGVDGAHAAGLGRRERDGREGLAPPLG
ncbi:MAG: hypothetical protein BJ554DRAFT_1824, partial [Olpidium bornovanus]